MDVGWGRGRTNDIAIGKSTDSSRVGNAEGFVPAACVFVGVDSRDDCGGGGGGCWVDDCCCGVLSSD